MPLPLIRELIFYLFLQEIKILFQLFTYLNNNLRKQPKLDVATLAVYVTVMLMVLHSLYWH